MKKRIMLVLLFFVIISTGTIKAEKVDSWYEWNNVTKHKNGKVKSISSRYMEKWVDGEGYWTETSYLRTDKIKKYDNKGRLIFSSQTSNILGENYEVGQGSKIVNSYSQFKKYKGKWFARKKVYKMYVLTGNKIEYRQDYHVNKYHNNKKIKSKHTNYRNYSGTIESKTNWNKKGRKTYHKYVRTYRKNYVSDTGLPKNAYKISKVIKFHKNGKRKQQTVRLWYKKYKNKKYRIYYYNKKGKLINTNKFI